MTSHPTDLVPAISLSVHLCWLIGRLEASFTALDELAETVEQIEAIA
jgi:hypothetical protein